MRKDGTRKSGEPRPCVTCGVSFAPRLDALKEGNGRYCSLQCVRTRPATERGPWPRVKGRSLSHRLWKKTDRTETCWVWRGGLTQAGYGTISLERKRLLVHRVSYELARGPISDGLHVLHHCDNPPCLNPDHLFLGTQQDNVADRVSKGRTAAGERQHLAKLTEDQVREIRRLWQQGGVSMAEMGRRFGVTVTPIWQILSGKTWRHVS